MKLICIDNNTCSELLTFGKIYEVDTFDDTKYLIFCDGEFYVPLYKSRFGDLAKYRDKKIDKILS